MFPDSRDNKCVYCADSIPIDSVQVYCKKLNCRMLWYKEKQDETRKYWQQRDLELSQKKRR